MTIAYEVPGVYYEPRPRAPEAPAVRTDVVGFIGFEPRVRDAGSALTGPEGAPPVGHVFRVDVAGFQLVVDDAGTAAVVPRETVTLSRNVAAIPIAAGQSAAYAIVAAGRGPVLSLVVVPGSLGPSGTERPPDDAAIDAGVPKPRRRVADVVVRRELNALFVTAHPSEWRAARGRRAGGLRLTRCDDFRDYELAFGAIVDDGTMLGPAVREFFANGGRRCWIATVRRPSLIDALELERAREDMIGVRGAGDAVATGLERLLLRPDVTIIDAPDLYARRIDRRTRTINLPPSERDACFTRCPLIPTGTATGVDAEPAWAPVYATDPLYDGIQTNAVFDAQKQMLARVVPERWRALLLLSVPMRPDGGGGRYVTPTDTDASDWVAQFDRLVKLEGFVNDTTEMSGGALYWPWARYQAQLDAPVVELPPSAYAAGIIARRDLRRGPQISPANETVRDAVAVAFPFSDTMHGRLYSPPPDGNGRPVPSVNVFRAFPGYGIQLWGARTLATEAWLRFIAVRRTLTAIELRMKAALDPLVFEPNTSSLWLQVTQIAFGVLLPLFESGALRGERPEEAFYVRCDASVNPPEAVARGQLLIEVGVAVAAPMEFIVFRLGRREGVVEVLE
jgi:hypothetical protein